MAGRDSFPCASPVTAWRTPPPTLSLSLSLLSDAIADRVSFAPLAAQIFGGASYVRGGQGEKVERLYREVRAFAIPGGSEEIMLDLAVKMAQKKYGQVLKSRL